MSELEKLCKESLKVIKSVGAFIHREVGKVEEEAIEQKNLNSLVSYVDREAEKRLVDELGRLLPHSTFLTEEDTVQNEDSDQQWIIDPLDGTTNFLHQLPCFSVSVALQRSGKTVLGIVYEVNRQEAFYAWKDGSAFLNGKPISVSKTPKLSGALLATGFPYHDFTWVDPYFQILRKFIYQSRGIRRFGSAAVDLAYTACGRFDAFFEYSLNPWDVAGGAFLVQEAGGQVSDFQGGGDYLFGGEIIAGNPLLFAEVQEIVEAAFYPEKQ
jgi:myo-inositol-1(or 4)-monophosphatase